MGSKAKLALAAFMISITTAACGKTDTTTDGKQSQSSPVPAPVAAVQTIGGIPTQANIDAAQKVAEEANKNSAQKSDAMETDK